MARRPAIAEEDLVDDAVREDEFANLLVEFRDREPDDDVESGAAPPR